MTYFATYFLDKKIIASIFCFNVFLRCAHSSGMRVLINKHEVYLVKY